MNSNAVRHCESRKTVREVVAGLARVQPNRVQRPNSGKFGYKNTSQRSPVGAAGIWSVNLGLRSLAAARQTHYTPGCHRAPLRGFFTRNFVKLGCGGNLTTPKFTRRYRHGRIGMALSAARVADSERGAQTFLYTHHF